MLDQILHTPVMPSCILKVFITFSEALVGGMKKI